MNASHLNHIEWKCLLCRLIQMQIRCRGVCCSFQEHEQNVVLQIEEERMIRCGNVKLFPLLMITTTGWLYFIFDIYSTRFWGWQNQSTEQTRQCQDKMTDSHRLNVFSIYSTSPAQGQIKDTDGWSTSTPANGRRGFLSLLLILRPKSELTPPWFTCQYWYISKRFPIVDLKSAPAQYGDRGQLHYL